MTILDSPFIDTIAPHVAELHRKACVFIGYTNPATRYRKDSIDAGWFAEDDSRIQGSLPNFRRGQADILALSVGSATMANEATGPNEPTRKPIFPTEAETIQMVFRHLDAEIQVVEDHPDDCCIARTVGEADQANSRGATAIFLHLTGAWVAGDLAILRAYHRLGVRSIHICVEGLRGVGDASDDRPFAGGLTDFGRKFVREMNRLGMVIDVAHASDQSARQIIELSDAPVISSHTCCRKFVPINRNLPDDLIEAIAQKGGVVGMHFAANFIAPCPAPAANQAYHAALKARENRLRAQYPNPYEFLSHWVTFDTEEEAQRVSGHVPTAPEHSVTIDHLIDHIDHVVQIAGIDHVGIGPDYDIGATPKGLEKASTLVNLTAGLVKRGYSDSDICKIWGDNFKRVYRNVIGG